MAPPPTPRWFSPLFFSVDSRHTADRSGTAARRRRFDDSRPGEVVRRCARSWAVLSSRGTIKGSASLADNFAVYEWWQPAAKRRALPPCRGRRGISLQVGFSQRRLWHRAGWTNGSGGAAGSNDCDGYRRARHRWAAHRGLHHPRCHRRACSRVDRCPDCRHLHRRRRRPPALRPAAAASGHHLLHCRHHRRPSTAAAAPPPQPHRRGLRRQGGRGPATSCSPQPPLCGWPAARPAHHMASTARTFCLQ